MCNEDGIVQKLDIDISLQKPKQHKKYNNSSWKRDKCVSPVYLGKGLNQHNIDADDGHKSGSTTNMTKKGRVG